MPPQDTIVAIATGTIEAAQGVIKVSGPEALDLVSKVFFPSFPQKELALCRGYEAVYGRVKEPETGEIIDDGVALVFRSPNSYTGEDVVELSLHGSPFLLSIVLRLLVQAGARPAEPGEFTRRAFSEGKMDLSQAEAVADLVASTNRAALRLAVTQLRGGFKGRIDALRKELTDFASLIELELDFSEEDVEFVSREELMTRCMALMKDIRYLSDSYRHSKVIKEGIPIAIVGETNAGKSTLLNAFLGEDRAIVSDIHGTTRDTVEELINIDGLRYRLIDTAGMRETDDTIEKIGIERSFESVKKASLVFWLIDLSQRPEDAAEEVWHRLLSFTEPERIQPVLNKKDLSSPKQMQSLLTAIGAPKPLVISAREEEDIQVMKKFLSNRFSSLNVSEGEVMVTNIRQEKALLDANESLSAVLNGLEDGLTGDLLSQHLRAAIMSLSSVIGEVTTDDLLGNIFANFCIGK